MFPDGILVVVGSSWLRRWWTKFVSVGFGCCYENIVFPDNWCRVTAARESCLPSDVVFFVPLGWRVSKGSFASSQGSAPLGPVLEGGPLAVAIVSSEAIVMVRNILSSFGRLS